MSIIKIVSLIIYKMALPESVMAALAEFSSARSAVRNVTMAEMAEIKSLTRPPQIVPKVSPREQPLLPFTQMT